MSALTDFGDAAVLLPLSVVILVWLLSDDSRRVVGSWVIAVGLSVATIRLLKIYLYASPRHPISLARVVTPALASWSMVQLRSSLPPSKEDGRAVVLLAGSSLIVAINGSRVWLDAQSAPDVAVGIVIGIAMLALFADQYVRFRTEGRQLRPVILSVVVVTAIFHGQALRAEAFLHAISRHLHLTSFACVG
jgi:hypothetical protein